MKRVRQRIWIAASLLLCVVAFSAAAEAQSVNGEQDEQASASREDSAADARRLTSHDPLVRQHAAEELARLAATEQRKLVEGYRLQEKNARVRLALDWALYRMGKSDALFTLVRELESTRAAQAKEYLTALETPEPLYQFLPLVNGNTEIALLEVLARSGDEMTLEKIKPYSASLDPKIANAAKNAERDIKQRLAAQPAAGRTRPRQIGAEHPNVP